jgi:hypothetical protein
VSPTEVRISLNSYPLGASVKIFGRVVCTTPCSTVVPLGSHIAEFTLPDGRTAMEVLQVTEDPKPFGHRFSP